MFQFPGFPSYTYGFSAWWQEFFLPGSPIQTSAAQWIFAPPRGFSQLITSFVGSQCQGIRPVPYLAWPFVPTSCSVMMRSVLFLRFLLKSVNLFFSMIYGLMCFWYAVFKVHCIDMSLINNDSGDGEIRTLDPLLARQVLSQLSYTPIWYIKIILF